MNHIDDMMLATIKSFLSVEWHQSNKYNQKYQKGTKDMLGIDIYLAAQTYSVIGSEPNVNNFFSVHGLGLIYPIYRKDFEYIMNQLITITITIIKIIAYPRQHQLLGLNSRLVVTEMHLA